MGELHNNNTNSQCNRLLRYLKSHKSGITTYQAFSILGIHRISARVADLKKRGYKIDTIMHREKGEDGLMKIWGQYVLRRSA